jgi:hypothetical protein
MQVWQTDGFNKLFSSEEDEQGDVEKGVYHPKVTLQCTS